MLSRIHYIAITLVTLVALLAATYFANTPHEESGAEAVRLLAEKGDGPSQYAMALRYEKGEGVPQSYFQTGYFLREAATRGVHEADVRLAKAHQICSQDRGKTLQGAHECQIDAEAGGVEAALIVAVLLDSGRLLDRNQTLAATWYNVAAIHGDGRAQLMMARAYAGNGLPANPVQEYAWNAAASENMQLPDDIREKARLVRAALRKKIETQLGASTLHQAEAQAQTYIAKYSNVNQ